MFVEELSSKLNVLIRDKVSFIGTHASGARQQMLFVGALLPFPMHNGGISKNMSGLTDKGTPRCVDMRKSE